MSLVVIGTAIGNAIAPWLGEWAIVGVATKLGEGAVKHFKPDQMTLLLKQSIAAAEAAQPKTGALFDRCHQDGYKGVKKFLEQFFQSGEVLKELQKPLQDKGKPDLAILIAAFKESAKQHPEAKEYLLNSLPLWMETLVESYFEQVKGICFQVAKAQYLQQLARRVDDVKFVGIAVAGEEVEKQEVLAQIFVMPDVREERSKNSQQLSRLEQLSQLDSIDWNAPEIIRNQNVDPTEFERAKLSIKRSMLLEEQKTWATRDRSAPRIPAQKVINLAQKKAVVLGAPGSGKTMLASYFALMLCETAQSDPAQIGLEKDFDYLPVVVRIRDWILQPNMGLLDYLRSNAEASLACKELPAGFFEHWLDRGRALILLDGVDEVVDEAQRSKVAEKIVSFLHQYKDNPAVITSRPAGYKGLFKSDEFPHYTLESFDDKQVATFIDHWYDSRLGHDKEKAQRRKADLQKAFARNERIRLLAKNPLLLTIITLIHRYQAELPRRRCNLYEIAVKTLLMNWDSGKEINLYEDVLKFLKSDDLLYILKKLAYWIHTQGSTGETEGGTLIDKDELIRWLRKEIQTLRKCEAHEAKGEAERFIDFIQRRTGLLNEQGRDRYAFVHKTFQEYLTAEEIFDRADVEDDTDIILSHFREHLHDQHWREVLLLLISKLKGKKAQKAIQTVLDAESEYEQWLHRDLLFAGWCLTEDPPELTMVAGDFVGEILDQLIDLEIEKSDRTGRKVSGEVGKILSCFGETMIEQHVEMKLELQNDNIDRLRILGFQASFLNAENEVDTLLSWLSEKESVVCYFAATALGELGNTSSEVVNSLLSSLRNREAFVQSAIAEALGKLGNINPSVVNSLLFLLLNDKESHVRSGAAEALGELHNPNEKVITGLLSVLDDQDWLVSFNAIESLGKLKNTGEDVISRLLSVLADQNSTMHSHVRLTLGTLGNTSPEVISGLLCLLGNKKSCSSAAEILGKLGDSNLEVLRGLLLLLDDIDLHVRSNAAVALVQSGNVQPAVVNVLHSLLHERDSNLCSRAAAALVQSGNVEPAVVTALLSLLHEGDLDMHPHAAVALVQLAKISDMILPEVVQWLEQNPYGYGIGSSIDCLWSIVVE